MEDEGSNSTPSLWSHLNIPTVLAGPLGAALSRLLGRALDIPGAHLEAKVQAIKDETRGRSMVSDALARAVAKKATKDPDMIERAMEAFVNDEIRKQENKEAVGQHAATLLLEKALTSSDKPTEPDQDWMNVFASHAENASTERLREMWGRVLAGEIRTPKSFSLKTLAFVAQLDLEVASIFEKYAASVANGAFIPAPMTIKSPELDELLTLEEFGLLANVDTDITQTLSLEPQHGGLVLGFGCGHIVFQRDRSMEPSQIELPIRCMLLTRVGREVYRILEPTENPFALDEIIRRLPKPTGISLIGLLDTNKQLIIKTLWKKPKPTTAD